MSLPLSSPRTNPASIGANALSSTEYARLIPGLANSKWQIQGRLRKQPRSVHKDRRMQAEAAMERIAISQRGPLQSIAFLMPQPMSLSPVTNLAPQVFRDIAILLTAATFILLLRTLLALGEASSLYLAPNLARLTLVFVQGVLVTLIAYSEGAYRSDLQSLDRETVATLAKSIFWSTAIVALIAKAQLPLLLSTGILGYAAMLATRSRSSRNAAKKNLSSASHNVLIVGANREARSFASYLQANPQIGKIVIGYLDDHWPLGDDILGRVADLEHVARARFVDELIVAVDDSATRRRAVRTATECQLDIAIVPNLSDCGNAHRIVQIGRWPLITVHQERSPALALIIKRALDLVGAALALFLTAPLLGAIVLWIKLDSVGPVFYAAPRVGRKGRRFRCYKFRSMSPNADALKQQLRIFNQREGPLFKIQCDPRITACGRWLRKYSLDELPQLWNVLRGDMSLVGPRPHPLDDFAGYQVSDLCRLDVRPGMTGLWQTTARRDPSFQTSMRLDKQYIEQWNLALDLRILLKTFRVVIAGGGC